MRLIIAGFMAYVILSGCSDEGRLSTPTSPSSSPASPSPRFVSADGAGNGSIDAPASGRAVVPEAGLSADGAGSGSIDDSASDRIVPRSNHNSNPTVTVRSVPSAHRGTSFWVFFDFSEDVIGSRNGFHKALRITGGRFADKARAHFGTYKRNGKYYSDTWMVRVTPHSRTSTVTVRILAGRGCTRFCDFDDNDLDSEVSHTIVRATGSSRPTPPTPDPPGAVRNLTVIYAGSSLHATWDRPLNSTVQRYIVHWGDGCTKKEAVF